MDQRGDLSRQVFTVYYNFIFQGKMGAGSWEELVQVSISIIKLETHEYFNMRSRRDCMVVGFTTTCAISGYRH
jgi:hypothetical protein